MAEDEDSSAPQRRPPDTTVLGEPGEETTAQGGRLGASAVANGRQEGAKLNNDDTTSETAGDDDGKKQQQRSAAQQQPPVDADNGKTGDETTAQGSMLGNHVAEHGPQEQKESNNTDMDVDKEQPKPRNQLGFELAIRSAVDQATAPTLPVFFKDLLKVFKEIDPTVAIMPATKEQEAAAAEGAAELMKMATEEKFMEIFESGQGNEDQLLEFLCACLQGAECVDEDRVLRCKVVIETERIKSTSFTNHQKFRAFATGKLPDASTIGKCSIEATCSALDCDRRSLAGLFFLEAATPDQLSVRTQMLQRKVEAAKANDATPIQLDLGPARHGEDVLLDDRSIPTMRLWTVPEKSKALRSAMRTLLPKPLPEFGKCCIPVDKWDVMSKEEKQAFCNAHLQRVEHCSAGVLNGIASLEAPTKDAPDKMIRQVLAESLEDPKCHVAPAIHGEVLFRCRFLKDAKATSDLAKRLKILIIKHVAEDRWSEALESKDESDKVAKALKEVECCQNFKAEDPPVLIAFPARARSADRPMNRGKGSKQQRKLRSCVSMLSVASDASTVASQGAVSRGSEAGAMSPDTSHPMDGDAQSAEDVKSAIVDDDASAASGVTNFSWRDVASIRTSTSTRSHQDDILKLLRESNLSAEEIQKMSKDAEAQLAQSMAKVATVIGPESAKTVVTATAQPKEPADGSNLQQEQEPTTATDVQQDDQQQQSEDKPQQEMPVPMAVDEQDGAKRNPKKRSDRTPPTLPLAESPSRAMHEKDFPEVSSQQSASAASPPRNRRVAAETGSEGATPVRQNGDWTDIVRKGKSPRNLARAQTSSSDNNEFAALDDDDMEVEEEQETVGGDGDANNQSHSPEDALADGGTASK